MNKKIIVTLYRIIGGICCTLIGGLSGFLVFGSIGAAIGACVGLVLGKMLDKSVLGDLA